MNLKKFTTHQNFYCDPQFRNLLYSVYSLCYTHRHPFYNASIVFVLTGTLRNGQVLSEKLSDRSPHCVGKAAYHCTSCRITVYYYYYAFEKPQSIRQHTCIMYTYVRYAIRYFCQQTKVIETYPYTHFSNL